MPDDSWQISGIAGRRYYIKNDKVKKKTEERAFLESIAEMDEINAANMERIKAAKDPDSYSGDITPLAIGYIKNTNERAQIIGEIQENIKRIEKVKGKIYDYILKVYNQLQYGNVVEDIFTQNRKIVDDKLTNICPESIKKFVSVFDNMDSTNPEDWANAVHSCRRIIKEVADNLYPPSDTPIEKDGRKIKIGEDQYINRIIQFIESKSDSKTYVSVVGTSLSSIGERLDSINNAVCKGTHSEVSKEEAQRYIIHTYILLGDILSFVK